MRRSLIQRSLIQRSSIALATLGLAGLMLSGLAGCGPSEEEVAAQKQEERQQAFEAIEEQKQALAESRQELSDLRAQLDEAPEEAEQAPAAEGEEGADGEVMTREELEQKIQQMEEELQSQTEAYSQALFDFLTDEDFPMIEGEPLTELQKKAIHMKSEEDMAIAAEYIEKGGNYRKAISIYETALKLDPDNEELQQALEEAESLRFMTQERFSQVKKGMTEDEVREVLGPPNLYNIKDYEQQGRKVTAWYYPKNAEGAAAAVWFQPRRGELRVYRTDFDVEGSDEEG